MPFFEDRPVKTVALMVVCGERGLCGAYNANIIKMTENRVKELNEQGIKCKLVLVGKKAQEYFKKRDFDIEDQFNIITTITSEDAYHIMNTLVNLWESGEADKIEIIYTNFISLAQSNPSIRTVLPLQPTGLENEVDEIFKLSSQKGKLVVEVEKNDISTTDFPSDMIFEQEPSQIVKTLIPLFLSSQILRAL